MSKRKTSKNEEVENISQEEFVLAMQRLLDDKDFNILRARCVDALMDIQERLRFVKGDLQELGYLQGNYDGVIFPFVLADNAVKNAREAVEEEKAEAENDNQGY